MALAKKCDRCGKLYEHYPLKNMPVDYNAITKVRRGQNGLLEYSGATLDLCTDCMKKFERFIMCLSLDIETEKEKEKE